MTMITSVLRANTSGLALKQVIIMRLPWFKCPFVAHSISLLAPHWERSRNGHHLVGKRFNSVLLMLPRLRRRRANEQAGFL